MRKITLACLARDKQIAIGKLQTMGTVHIVHDNTVSSDEFDRLKNLQGRLADIYSAVRALPDDVVPVPMPKYEPAIALDRGCGLIREIEDTHSIIEECRNAISQLRPWGAFSIDTICTLRSKGLHVALCTAPSGRIPELPEGVACKVISESGGTVYFAVFGTCQLDELGLVLASFPEDTDMHMWEAKEAEAVARMSRLQSFLAGFAAANMDSLKAQDAKMAEMSDFMQACDGMESSGRFAFLRGYVPTRNVKALHKAALENLWVVEDREISEDDTDVPTNLVIPKPFRMARHIFDFVGILPGYHETDVSIAMLVFLSIFCGMLVGDAGYGLLFTCGILYFRRKARTDKAREGLNLLLVMSCAILVFGALSGNWFAIPVEKMPGPLGGLPWLSKNDAQKHVQLLCFFIAAFHMSMASLWRALQEAARVDFRNDDIWKFLKCMRSALGQIGWGLFLWGNFGLAKLLIVDGGSVGELSSPFVWLYGVGFVFILLFNINWKDMGTVIYMPFSFVNSFVDVLSYIRLFAVGLSSVYIADSFNSMAAGLVSGSPWMIPVAVIILALGHALNIALACMGVLVHGIRLNTLEFSGRMDLSWSGKPYKPLSSKSCNQ